MTHAGGMAERSEHRAVGMGLKLVIHMEAGVGGCTAQQAVDLAHTEMRIQLTILRKLLTVMKNV